MTMTTAIHDFDAFFRAAEPRLRRAYGGRIAPDQVADAVGAALEYAWKNWDRIAAMEYPVPYLFRVGLSKSRRRKQGRLPASPPHEITHVEPALISTRPSVPGGRSQPGMPSGRRCIDEMMATASSVSIPVPVSLTNPLGSDATSRRLPLVAKASVQPSIVRG